MGTGLEAGADYFADPFDTHSLLLCGRVWRRPGIRLAAEAVTAARLGNRGPV
jgi:hypothetical protein